MLLTCLAWGFWGVGANLGGIAAVGSRVLAISFYSIPGVCCLMDSRVCSPRFLEPETFGSASQMLFESRSQNYGPGGPSL